MKTLLVMLTLLGFISQTNAALISYWSFDGSIGTTIDTDDELGNGTLTLSGGGGTTITTVTGTSLNDPFFGAATPATSFLNGGAPNRTYTILIQVTGDGSHRDWVVTYASQNPDAVLITQTWASSTTSASEGFTTLGSPSGSLGTSFGPQTADFSSVSALDDFDGPIWFRNTVIFAGAGANFDFDNIQVNATPIPEPINVALACFGVGFVGLKLGRRVFSAKR